MSKLLNAVAAFRRWAVTDAQEDERWECGYEWWPSLIATVLEFFRTRPFSTWTNEEIEAVLYSIARDNEMSGIAPELSRTFPDLLLPLTQTAVERDEVEALWQLVDQLSCIVLNDPEQERLLVRLLDHHNGGVRNESLRALTLLGHPAIESFADVHWHRPDPGQEWARMRVLYCLYNIGSSKLESYLVQAEKDARPTLRMNADYMRLGKVGKWTKPVRRTV